MKKLPNSDLPTVIERDASDKEGLRHEYSEVSDDIRNHGTLRFNIFTVFLAAMGGIGSIAFGLFDFKSGSAEQMKLWARIGGFVVTLLFFYYELRVQSLIDHNLRVAKELELLLDYNRVTSRPPWGKRRSHNATRIFFSGLLVFWLVLVMKMVI